MTWAEAAIELSAILKQIDQEFLAKDAEIERLKEANETLKAHMSAAGVVLKQKDQLITELVDALEKFQFFGKDPLIQRAREATR